MKKNVGDLDAMVRIGGGLFLLGLGITEDSKSMMAFGSWKVAEGITRFCPAMYFLGLSTQEGPLPNRNLVYRNGKAKG
ncbi:MAG: DUF2892 domain-containing protein [Clostridia bacterium]|jgi:hypothetical protein|nr:DUF2892 domain-containing protein [Clostridia bacterium]